MGNKRDLATLLEVAEVLQRTQARTTAAHEYENTDYSLGCYNTINHVLNMLDSFIKYTDEEEHLYSKLCDGAAYTPKTVKALLDAQVAEHMHDS